MRVKLVGTHKTAAPIHEIAGRLAGTFFSVEGIVEFKPVEDNRYIVTGELTKERSCVWIAEETTKAPSSDRICTN